MAKVLIIDDEPRILRSLDKVADKNYQVTKASNSRAAREALRENSYNLVVINKKIFSTECTAFIKGIKTLNADTMVILLASSYDNKFSTEISKIQVDDFILTPSTLAELRIRVNNCLGKLEEKRKNAQFEERIQILNEQILNMLMLIAHDIRSPLISMGATLKLLARGIYGEMEDEVRNSLDDLCNRIKMLLGTAEDYLAKATVIKDGLAMERKPLDLRQDIINPVLEELSLEIENKNISINTGFDPVSPHRIPIKANKVCLQSVFRNLFYNAIKYGGPGCNISFGIEKDDSTYKLNVFNSGNPIPEDYQNKLFAKVFRNGGDIKQEEENGMGLSLYLVKKIVKRHGGDIWYEPQQDGSNFVLTLPCN